MSYTKQTWETGDTITAQKLNHMEDGISNCGLFVVTLELNAEAGSYSCDKTNEEIYNAWLSGANVVAMENMSVYNIFGVDESYASFYNIYISEHHEELEVDCYEISTEDSVQTVTSTTLTIPVSQS